MEASHGFIALREWGGGGGGGCFNANSCRQMHSLPVVEAINVLLRKQYANTWSFDV